MKYINEYNNYENNLFNKINNKPEVFIASLLKDLEIKYYDKYPQSTFFVHKETEEKWMEDDKITRRLYVSYHNIWSKIQSLFPYNDREIRGLIRYTVETGFKMKVGTPVSRTFF